MNIQELGSSAVDLMRTHVVIEHFVASQEFKKDSVTVVDRVGPKALQRALQRMGLEAGIKGVRSEDLISFGGVGGLAKDFGRRAHNVGLQEHEPPEVSRGSGD